MSEPACVAAADGAPVWVSKRCAIQWLAAREWGDLLASKLVGNDPKGVVADQMSARRWRLPDHLCEPASSENVGAVEDGTLDAVWLDDPTSGLGDRVRQWWPKLRPGGYLGGPACGFGFVDEPRRRHPVWAPDNRGEVFETLRGVADASEVFPGDGNNPCWFAYRVPDESENVLVISGADRKQSRSFGGEAQRNHRAYAERHGYTYRWMDWEHCWNEPRHVVWAKVWAVIGALAERDWTQVWWVDADAAFYHFDKRLCRFLHPSWSAVHPQFWRQRPMASTGVWGTRPDGLPALEDVWQRDKHGFGYFSEEQCIGDSIYGCPDLWERALLVDHRLFNAVPGKEIVYPNGSDNFVLHFAGLENRHRRDVIAAINRGLGIGPEGGGPDGSGGQV